MKTSQTFILYFQEFQGRPLGFLEELLDLWISRVRIRKTQLYLDFPKIQSQECKCFGTGAPILSVCHTVIT